MHRDIDKLLQKAKREVPDPIERFKKVIAEVTSRVSVMGSAFMTDIKKEIPDLWRECEEFREREIYEYIGGILKEGIKKEDKERYRYKDCCNGLSWGYTD